MANIIFTNISIIGMSLCLPQKVMVNKENKNFPEIEIDNFIKHVGVKQFRVADNHCTAADLGFKAADKLLNDLKMDKSTIDLLVFVSQTPDYNCIPNTSPILQHKLGLSKSTICLDLPLGCSGFTTGLSLIASYLQNENINRALLICAETSSKALNILDKSVSLLFGDAASAIILESNADKNSMICNTGNDGSGYEAIIIPDGGYRNPFSEKTLMEKEFEGGLKRRDCELSLNGMDVFSFGISQAPKTVKELYQFGNIENNDVDYAIFHQANKMMNEMIRKKLKLDEAKVPYSLELYGNTSSVSIPLTMITQLKNKLQTQKLRLLLCGFGVGLSWTTCYITTDKIFISDIIEY